MSAGASTLQRMASTHHADPLQQSLTDLDPALRDITFVVVDLETTGGSAAGDGITEVGAVKVRGGEVLGEFATLVNPGRPIPPQITLLTSITDAMVAPAPRIESVLPAFLEFARGCVLVAHNARFDIGFLRAACSRMEIAWPNHAVVDTVRLARSVFSRAEVPSVRLGVLAPLLGARVAPDHRALTDARATVDVLHALLERLGPLGVITLPDLVQAERAVDPARRRKRHLADSLPTAPGVYLFRDTHDEVLYVGTSGNLRSRVRSYFTAAETRGRIMQMVLLAERVDTVVCATRLEAAIREQRLIAAHQPRYNRRSRNPDRTYWIRLTDETFPRLAVTATPPPDTAASLGPISSRRVAHAAVEAIQAAVPIRRCGQRLPRHPRGTPCALYELGRCGAPCAGHEAPADYARHVDAIRALFEGRSAEPLDRLRARVAQLSDAERYAAAAAARDELSTLVTVLAVAQRLRAFTSIAEMVVARPDGAAGWEIAVIRYGRLAAAGHATRGIDPVALAESLRRSAETVLPTGRATPSGRTLPAASAEESRTILDFVEQPDVRLVRCSGPWSQPVGGAARWEPFTAAAASARANAAELIA